MEGDEGWEGSGGAEQLFGRRFLRSGETDDGGQGEVGLHVLDGGKGMPGDAAFKRYVGSAEVPFLPDGTGIQSDNLPYPHFFQIGILRTVIHGFNHPIFGWWMEVTLNAQIALK